MATTFLGKKNNAKTTITNNPLTAGGLSITLASSSGSKFPTGSFIATLWDDVTYPNNPTGDPNMELVLCDSRSGDTATVNASGRGYGGTTGVEHATGAAFAILISKEHFDEIESAINTLEGASVGAFTPWTSWTPTLESGATDWNFSTKEARYCKIGKVVFIQIYLAGTVTVGSASPGLISLPIAASASGNSIQNINYIWSNQSTFNFVRGFIATTDTGNIRGVLADDASALNGNAVASGHKIYINGFYEIA